jgi:hypothetical protein
MVSGFVPNNLQFVSTVFGRCCVWGARYELTNQRCAPDAGAGIDYSAKDPVT